MFNSRVDEDKLIRKEVQAELNRRRMFNFLLKKKEFFQLTDLEKIAQKEIKIKANCVKETIESLVDNGAVDTDKMGQSIYFWVFPSKIMNEKKLKLQQIKLKLKDSSKKLKSLEEIFKNLNNERQDSTQRKKLIELVTDYEIEIDNIKNQLDFYEENDSRLFDHKLQEIQKLKDACNRWTDNIFAIKLWCKKKYNIEEDVLFKQFEIPNDIDYFD